MHSRFVSVQDLKVHDVVLHNSENVAISSVRRSPDGMHWQVTYATASRYEVVPNGAKFERAVVTSV